MNTYTAEVGQQESEVWNYTLSLFLSVVCSNPGESCVYTSDATDVVYDSQKETSLAWSLAHSSDQLLIFGSV